MLQVAQDAAYGQFSTRRIGHRIINVEWPEDYPYKDSLRLRPGVKALGHTETPGYTA